jgi:hypothetical protein
MVASMEEYKVSSIGSANKNVAREIQLQHSARNTAGICT